MAAAEKARVALGTAAIFGAAMHVYQDAAVSRLQASQTCAYGQDRCACTGCVTCSQPMLLSAASGQWRLRRTSLSQA